MEKEVLKLLNEYHNQENDESLHIAHDDNQFLNGRYNGEQGCGNCCSDACCGYLCCGI